MVLKCEEMRAMRIQNALEIAIDNITSQVIARPSDGSKM